MFKPNLSGLGEIIYFASKLHTVQYLHLNGAAPTKFDVISFL